MAGMEGTIVAAVATGVLLFASAVVSKRIPIKKTAKAANGTGEKTDNARAYLQTALDQATQAEAASLRANTGNRDSRLAAAEEAHYFAVAAEEAASNATNAAAGGPLEANDVAAQARNAAVRARAAADRARYNAHTGI